MLIPLSEHELLVFWVQIAALVGMARFLGWGMRRIGLPGIIGELLAGLVLGPSVFGKVWEGGFEWFLPEGEASQSAALLAVSWLGVTFLLVVTGFETDLSLISKLGRSAALVTSGSLVLPMAGGFLVGYLLPDSFLPEDSNRTVFVLFISLALAVSSLAVVAKILGDLGLMRRDFGQITVAAGMANDVIGWLLLGIYSGLAISGEFDPAETFSNLGLLVLFLVLSLTLGQKLVDRWLRLMRKSEDALGGSVSILVVVVLVFAVITQWLKVEAVLGAFVAGVVLNRSRFFHEHALERVENFTTAFFAPLFFATAGLRLDVTALNNTETLLWLAVILLVAIGFKFLGSYWGARLAGRTRRGGVALGAGLNARGALEIVIATVGLSLGVFNDVSYTAIVLVPIVTSLFASVLLRIVVRNWRGDPGELDRLAREEALSKNLIVTDARMLVPSRGGVASIAAAQVLHFAWPSQAGATIITVDTTTGSTNSTQTRGISRFLRAGTHSLPSYQPTGDLTKVDVKPLLNVFHDRDVEHRNVQSIDVAETIVEESRLGFGVIGLGINKSSDTASKLELSSLVDELLSVSQLPVVLVRRASDGLPAAFGRVVVPVDASPQSRMACEIACNFSAQLGTQVLLAHVLQADKHRSGLSGFFGFRRDLDHVASQARNILNKTATLASEIGIEPQQLLRTASSRSQGIDEIVEEKEADLVIMGAQLRRVNNRAYLGDTVESTLNNSPATVVVVLTPFDL